VFDDKGLITRERALEVIGPDRLLLLPQLQRRAWDEWVVLRATKEGATISPSGRARIVYDATVRLATASFPERQCTWHHGLLVVDLDEVLIRFKMVNDEFVPRGIPTGQATAFEEQAHVLQPQMSIWPPKPMLIVGYVVDAFGMEIKRQALILRRGRVMWWHELWRAGGEIPVPPTLPTPAPTGSPEAATVRSTRSREEAEREAQ
jgi:hypothetical protein